MIEVKNLHIQYNDIILDNETIDIPNGHLTLITGKSGIGKTTLLYRLGLISDDQSFEYYYNGKKLTTQNERETFRINNISFVLQDMYFLSHFTVLETIQYFLKLSSHDYSKVLINELLDTVDLEVDINQKVETLSLGEKQRLSIMCSLIKQPKLLLLDEPTASLDADNEQQIFRILKNLAKTGVHVVVASHSEVAREYADVIYNIEDKKLKVIMDVQEQIKNNDESLRKVTSKFLFNYVKKYLNSYRFIYTFAIMIFTLSAVSCITFNIMTEEMKNSDIEILEKQFDNKLLITKDEDSLFIDQNYKKYMSSFDMETAYPLYQMKALIGNEEINILPYFNEDQIKQSLSSSFSENTDGIYMDRITYQKYKNTENNDIKMTLYDKDKTFDLNRKIYVNGVMTDNYEQHYTSQPQRFVFMPYASIQEIYESFPTSHQYPAYVVMYDDYKQLVDSKNHLEKEGYHINDAFVDIQTLENIEIYYTRLQTIINVIIFIIIMIIDIVVTSHLHLQKRKENVFLRVNGLTCPDMIKMDIFEYIFEIVVTLVISIIITSIILIFLVGMNINTLKIISVMSFIYFIIFLIERFIQAYMEFHHYTIEKVLREREVS